MHSVSDLEHLFLWYSRHTSSCSHLESFWFSSADTLKIVLAAAEDAAAATESGDVAVGAPAPPFGLCCAGAWAPAAAAAATAAA